HRYERKSLLHNGPAIGISYFSGDHSATLQRKIDALNFLALCQQEGLSLTASRAGIREHVCRGHRRNRIITGWNAADAVVSVGVCCSFDLGGRSWYRIWSNADDNADDTLTVKRDPAGDACQRCLL